VLRASGQFSAGGWALALVGVLCGLLFAGVSHAQSERFAFTQGGFSEGAVLTGFFAGADLDGNGKLSSLEGELTDFAMHFSGNSLVPAFSIGLDGLDGLVYFLNGGPLGDEDHPTRGEGIRARMGDLTYVIGPGPDETALLCASNQSGCFFQAGVMVDGSEMLMQVQEAALASTRAYAVPLAGWLGWMLMGLLLLWAAGHHRHRFYQR